MRSNATYVSSNCRVRSRCRTVASICHYYRKTEYSAWAGPPRGWNERGFSLVAAVGATAKCEAYDANSSGPDRPPAIGDLAHNGSDAAAIRGVAGGRTIARAEDEDLRADHEADAAARGRVVFDC